MRLSGDYQASTVPSIGKVKMEDRKRSLAIDADDVVQPSKRAATAANGAAVRMEPEKEKEIENYQKDAIFRQMKEYKRERALLESQVSDLTKRSAYHDDHLRIVDAWFTQLLDELRILVNENVPSSGSVFEEIISTPLLAGESSVFEEHLRSRSGKIRSAIQELYGRLPPASPEVRDLQERLAGLLAAEKAHIVELQRVTGERDQLSERLENASYRYLLAEKKLDRAKSSVVQKLEAQYVMRSTNDGAAASGNSDTPVKTEGSGPVNGEVDSTAMAAVESARKEALAGVEARKLQVEQLEAENKRLNEELSAVKIQRTSATDDDYAQTDMFKLLKSQHEDVIKRVNDLEATNLQLREEAQKMQAERTAYRTKLDEEARTVTSDNESQLARAETDLARVRNLRDELTADLTIRKSSQDEQQQSLTSAKELVTAGESRIAALESEVQRLKLQIGESKASTTSDALDALEQDALKDKLRTLENQYSLLSDELPSMEAAWKRSSALATKKVAEIFNWEEQLQRLNAEKAKADQKYFGAMKAKESREVELRNLKNQSAKASEIVMQLKEAESSTRTLAINLEKQVVESKDSLATLSQQNRSLQQKISEASITTEGLKTQIAELKTLVGAKDASVASAASGKRQVEVELEEVKARLEESKKQTETLKKRTAANKDSADSSDDWRKVAICPICNVNLRNTVLKLCSHVFCNNCVQDLFSHRSRKCPTCAKGFGVNDSMPVHLT